MKTKKVIKLALKYTAIKASITLNMAFINSNADGFQPTIAKYVFLITLLRYQQEIILFALLSQQVTAIEKQC